MNNSKISVLLFLLISIMLGVFPHVLKADDIKVSSNVSDDKIGIEDYFIYTIIVETSANKSLDVDVKFDKFPADYLRPSISTSMSTSFINGRMSSSRTQSHKYTVYPREEGILDIPQVEVVVNGKKYLTQSHKIQVLPGSLRQQNQSRNQNYSPFSSFFDSDFDDFGRNDIDKANSFVEIEVSRDTVYIGQNITAKYLFYTQNNRNNISYDLQAFDGYGYDSKSQDNESWERVNYKGRSYYRIEITSFNISAQKTGLLTLPLIKVNESRFLTSRTINSPMKKFLVLDLPEEGKAIDFSNAIGRFTISANLNQTLMFENQQNQLIVTIQGTGNFAKILYPNVENVDGLEILKPKATLDIDDRDEGKLVLFYDIIPYESGKFKIPSISFNYFDEENKEYKTLYTENILLTVKKLGEDTSGVSTENIFYNKNKPYLDSIKQEYLLIEKKSYWLILSLIVLGIIFYLTYSNINNKKMSNISYVRKKEAIALLKKTIEDSKDLVNNNSPSFYTNAQNSLLKFIVKITNSSLQLSQPELMDELAKTFVNKVTIGKINSFLTYCEQIKYRPNFHSSENIDNDYKRLIDIYNEIKNTQG